MSGGLRLAMILAGVVAVLALADLAVPLALEREDAMRATDAARTEIFRRVVYRNFAEANANVNAAIARGHRRFEALSDAKAPDELRIFLIGNSASQFSIVPEVIEQRIAAARPDRRITVFALLFPDVGVTDEQILVRAALRKDPDVIVLTPNLKGLIKGHEIRVASIRDRFEPERQDPGLLERLRDVLRRHWHAFGARDELREAFSRELDARLPVSLGAREERRAIEVAFAAVSDAAADRDVGRALDVYRRSGLVRFVPQAIEAHPLPRRSPIYATLGETARLVRRAGVHGIAIFLPINPLYRDPVATADHPEVRVDDRYVHALARATLSIYRDAGFVTVDRLDALDAADFIDLVHPNAAGMRAFTDEASNILLEAIERRPGPQPPRTRR